MAYIAYERVTILPVDTNGRSLGTVFLPLSFYYIQVC
jgi:DUF1365 family protein